jgi:hypothetical protein
LPVKRELGVSGKQQNVFVNYIAFSSSYISYLEKKSIQEGKSLGYESPGWNP